MSGSTVHGLDVSTGSLVSRYVLPPEQIESLSFERVEAALGPHPEWTEAERQVARRVVYAAGDPGLARAICFGPDAAEAGRRALRAGGPLLVDVRMVETGLDRARAERLGCAIHCRIDDPDVAREARRNSLPRALVAMRALAREHPTGVFVIGNAPTALLGLLDLIDAGEVQPSLVVGTPVGFVAATESKTELRARSVPYITILGTRGGSAVAAAAANALLRLASDSA